MLYGTFDHPKLINYAELKKNLKELLETGQTQQPKYSFVEKRTTHYEHIEGKYDFIIVEGIYTIHSLSKYFDSTNIFVYSEKEELIFRRIIRDQQRVAEPTYLIVENIGKAFPMRTIFGVPQIDKSHIIIDNDYKILQQKGRKCMYCTIDKKKSEFGKVTETKYITDFIYEDDNPKDGDIMISEVYKEKDGLLDYVIITKVKNEKNGEQHTIDLKLYQPGILIQLHTLVQTA